MKQKGTLHLLTLGLGLMTNDPGQVCDKNTLQMSQVLNDTCHTCKVANVYGDD